MGAGNMSLQTLDLWGQGAHEACPLQFQVISVSKIPAMLMVHCPPTIDILHF